MYFISMINKKWTYKTTTYSIASVSMLWGKRSNHSKIGRKLDIHMMNNVQIESWCICCLAIISKLTFFYSTLYMMILFITAIEIGKMKYCNSQGYFGERKQLVQILLNQEALGRIGCFKPVPF